MRHQHQPRSLLRQPPQRLAQFALRRQGPARSRARPAAVAAACAPAPAQSDPPLLPGRHLAHQLPRQVPGLHPLQRFPRPLPHLPVTCRLGHSVDAEKNPAITASSPVVTAVRSPGNPPRPPLQNAFATRSDPTARARRSAPTFRPHNGIHLAGHGHNQRRLPAPVRPQNRHMLPGAHRQVHVVQHHPLAARHIHMPQFKKLACAQPFPPPCPRRSSSSQLPINPHLLD
jgi:hypothetical protein